jgi:hypothetical protein
MPSPPNTRDQEPEVAPLVARLLDSGAEVEAVEATRQAARVTRREAAAAAFAAGISWRRIAELGRYGTAQAAQQDVTSKTSLNRRSTDR